MRTYYSDWHNEKEKRRQQLEDKILLALISFFSGLILGLVWAYAQKP